MSRPLPPGLDRLPSGKIRARYRDPETGKQHSKSFDGSRAAQTWLRAQRAAVDRGEHIAPGDRTTVAEYARRWADTRAYRRSSQAQATTYVRHLTDTPLGAMPLRAVRPSDVQEFVSDRAQGYAAQTVRNLYTFVKAVFASAVEDRLIVRTPCTSRVSVPRVHREKVVPLTVEQVRALAACMPERYRVAVYLQAALGLRVSELLGLHVHDIDFLHRRVRVEQQLGRGGRTLAPLKTEASRRTIPLARDVVDLVAAHVHERVPGRQGFLIVKTTGQPLRQDYYTTKVFRDAVTAAGLPAGTTPHDLRHHFASVLLAQGVPVNVVADYMGHSNASLVLSTYGHLMPDSDDVVRTALDASWTTAAVTALSGR